jgi:ribosomal protein S12 methylthiotransferase accessory factor
MILTEEAVCALPPAAGEAGQPTHVETFRGALVAPARAWTMPGFPAGLVRAWVQSNRELLQGRRGSEASTTAAHPAIGSPWFAARVAALSELAERLDAEHDGSSVIPVWELDGSSGGIRRGSFLVAMETGPTIHAEPGLAGLRGRRLSELRLPEDALANPVSGTVGRSTSITLTWETSAPAHGWSDHWTTDGFDRMSWSSQLSRYSDSRTAALLEGMERQAGARNHSKQGIISTARALSGRYVHPEEFGTYPQDVYDGSARYARFSADDERRWLTGTSLIDGADVFVPSELIFYREPVSLPIVADSCSSGCATGSSWEEAAVFGLLEVIERDAFISEWYSGRCPRGIAIDHGPAHALSLRAGLLGFRLHAFRSATDLGIPVVTAMAEGPNVVAFGAAAHPDPAEALVAACAEAMSYLPEREQRVSREPELVQAMQSDYANVTGIDDHPLLFTLPEMKPILERYFLTDDARPLDIVFSDSIHLPRGGPVEVLNYLSDLLRERGFEATIVRITTAAQSALGLECVKAVVPGLVPIDFGWERQRALRMQRVLDLVPPDPDGRRVPVSVPHPFS